MALLVDGALRSPSPRDSLYPLSDSERSYALNTTAGGAQSVVR